MRIIRAANYRRMQWKNGGGETTEIAVSPPGAALDDFALPISMAHGASGGARLSPRRRSPARPVAHCPRGIVSAGPDRNQERGADSSDRRALAALRGGRDRRPRVRP